MTQLFSVQLPAAGTGYIAGIVEGFDSILAAAVQARLSGTGGTSVTAWLQTSVDGGVTFYDLVCVHFTAAGTLIANVNSQSALDPVAITDGTLAVNTVRQGPVGDRFRLRYNVVGAWSAGSVLQIDIADKT